MNPLTSNGLYAISRWGKTHKWTSRFILIIGHFLLAGSAALVGSVLLPYAPFEQGVTQILLLLIAGGVALQYAKKRSRKGHAGWAIRKKGEGAFLLCGVLLLLLTGPALREDRISFGAMPAFASATNAPAVAKKQTRVGQFLKKMVRKYQDMSTGAKVALTVLIVLLTLALGVGVLALGCSLSCNGAETAGALVMIFGSTGLILLAAYAFHKIYKD